MIQDINEQTNRFQHLERKFLNLKEKERHLNIINDFSISLNFKNTEEEIIWLLAKKVVSRLGFVDCVVYILDEKRQVLVQKAAFGPKNPYAFEIKNPMTIEIGQGIVGAVAASGNYELIGNTKLDNRYILDDDFRLSEIAVPIIFENKVIGVIDSEHPETFAFDEGDLSILMTLSAMVSSKIMHARSIETLRQHQFELENLVEEKTIQLSSTIDRLERSNQDLERFAFAASHDLQEPLRTVISYLQLFRRKHQNVEGEAKEFLDFAVDGTKRMKQLLDGLLKYSTLKRSEDDFELVDLNDILFLVKANLANKIKRSKAQIDAMNLPSIEGDKTQLMQLFQNLISNAIKFVPEGRTPHITLVAKDMGTDVCIELKDNGLGIDKIYHSKIFELFQQLNSRAYYQGSGIGLAICQRIVNHHSGSIRVESELGKGTTFIFTLGKTKPVIN